jgi:hypothetical protein
LSETIHQDGPLPQIKTMETLIGILGIMAVLGMVEFAAWLVGVIK